MTIVQVIYLLEDLTCNIDNRFIQGQIGNPGLLHVTKEVTCADENGVNSPRCAGLLATITEDEEDLSALEKIAKLKQQWLNLLP